MAIKCLNGSANPQRITWSCSSCTALVIASQRMAVDSRVRLTLWELWRTVCVFVPSEGKELRNPAMWFATFTRGGLENQHLRASLERISVSLRSRTAEKTSHMMCRQLGVSTASVQCVACRVRRLLPWPGLHLNNPWRWISSAAPPLFTPPSRSRVKQLFTSGSSYTCGLASASLVKPKRWPRNSILRPLSEE